MTSANLAPDKQSAASSSNKPERGRSRSRSRNRSNNFINNNYNNNGDNDNDNNNDNNHQRVPQNIQLQLSPENPRLLNNRKSVFDSRNNAVYELLVTERSYLKGLAVIDNIFYAPLLASLDSNTNSGAIASDNGNINALSIVNGSSRAGTHTPILQKKDLRIIFSDFPAIYSLSAQFLQDLSARLEPQEKDGDIDGSSRGWDPECSVVGDITLKYFPFMKMYSLYLSNYADSLFHFDLCFKENSSFYCFMKNAEKHKDCAGLPFKSYLLLPVQRIPRYRMLVKTILENTPESHPDYLQTKASFDTIDRVAKIVNDRIREQEMIIKILEIQKALNTNQFLLAPGRKLIKQGYTSMAIKSVLDRKKLYLFSDIFIYISFGKLFRDPESVVIPLEELSLCNSEIKGQSVIKLVHQNKIIPIFMETVKEKQDWEHVLLDAITTRTLQIASLPLPLPRFSLANNRVSGSDPFAAEAAFQAATTAPGDGLGTFKFDPVSMIGARCLLCKRKYNLFAKRHVCRECKKSVCGLCAKKNKAGPLCKSCAEVTPSLNAKLGHLSGFERRLEQEDKYENVKRVTGSSDVVVVGGGGGGGEGGEARYSSHPRVLEYKTGRQRRHQPNKPGSFSNIVEVEDQQKTPIYSSNMFRDGRSWLQSEETNSKIIAARQQSQQNQQKPTSSPVKLAMRLHKLGLFSHTVDFGKTQDLGQSQSQSQSYNYNHNGYYGLRETHTMSRLLLSSYGGNEYNGAGHSFCVQPSTKHESIGVSARVSMGANNNFASTSTSSGTSADETVHNQLNAAAGSKLVRRSKIKSQNQTLAHARSDNKGEIEPVLLDKSQNSSVNSTATNTTAVPARVQYLPQSQTQTQAQDNAQDKTQAPSRTTSNFSLKYCFTKEKEKGRDRDFSIISARTFNDDTTYISKLSPEYESGGEYRNGRCSVGGGGRGDFYQNSFSGLVANKRAPAKIAFRQ